VLVERLTKDNIVVELSNIEQSKLLVSFSIYITRIEIRKKTSAIMILKQVMMKTVILIMKYTNYLLKR
jgi:hypothetical protein